MSRLLTLIKLLSSLYQARRIKDDQLESEILDIYGKLEPSKGDLFTQDKKIEDSIRDTIKWLVDQPKDIDIIKSNLIQRVMDFAKDAPETKSSIECGLEDYDSEERTRMVIYKHIKEVRQSQEDDAFNKLYKDTIKESYFGVPSKMSKDQWVKLSELIEKRINTAYMDARDTALVEEVNSDDINGFVKIIERAQKESSEEGVISLGLQGLNRALAPDYGLRRGKSYLTPALTNRGKSFNIGHMLASVGLYNNGHQKLRDKSKIPTVVLDSAEDSLEIIIERLYKLVMSNKFDIPIALEDDIFNKTDGLEIAKVITDAFIENGWFLKINRINPSEDNYLNLFERVRKLEMSGHEIIVYFYDYLGIMDLKGCVGDSKADKLQNLISKVKTFFGVRGIAWVTPWQLSPEAKKQLRESDEDSELMFAKEVAGRSMTEGTTKATNEVDVEITIHIARTSDGKVYYTFCVGKFRGEGAPLPDRFGIYPIHPKYGLQHDFGKKNACRRSFKHIIDANTGENIEDFDYVGD